MANKKVKTRHEIAAEKFVDLFDDLLKRENHGIVEYTDCPLCGGKKTIYYVRAIPNKKFRGGCTACGIEF